MHRVTQRKAEHYKKYLEDYQEDDFILPDEELSDGRLTYHEQQVLRNQNFRIKEANKSLREEAQSVRRINALHTSSFLEMDANKRERLYANGASTNLLGRESRIKVNKARMQQEAQAELSLIKAVIGRHPDLARVTAKMTPEDYGDESTLDYPKLGSLQEAQEDLRLEDLEAFYNSHGANAAIKWSCKDRRMLRRWFKALDYDGSREVSVPELQDPLISSGILKTRDQVYCVLLNADKNGTMGLDFKEFLDALNSNSLAKVDQLKKLQSMGADTSGFKMDTLVTAERRKKLINSICEQNQKRSASFDAAFKKLMSSGDEKSKSHIKAARALEETEKRAVYERLLHSKSIESLSIVVDQKRALQNEIDDALSAGITPVYYRDAYAPESDRKTYFEVIQDQQPDRPRRLNESNPYACYERQKPQPVRGKR